MEVVILGSGTYQPEVERHPSSYLVKADGQNIVFDFGRGTLDSLMKNNVNYNDIDAIFISHPHADHSEELTSFMHICLWELPPYDKRTKDVTIYGPKGIAKTIEHIILAFHMETAKPKFKVAVKELIEGDAVRCGHWLVRVYKTKHVPIMESVCYRFEADRKVLAYSGDTVDCKGLREACRGADLAIIEAAWPKDMKSPVHLTGEETGKIAQECGVKHLVLTHVSPIYMEIDPVGDAEKFYKGPITLAHDMMKMRV